MIYELICHGVTARNMDQVRSYLTGDAHDQTKVEMFDGSEMVAAVDAPAGNYPVCSRNGEQASLLILVNDRGERQFSLA